MFYVTSTQDVGANALPLNEKFWIGTTPPRTNGGNEIKVDGWLGTTNDIAEYAHGQYTDLDRARAVIATLRPNYRVSENAGYWEDVVEVYVDPRTVWTASDYFQDPARQQVTASSSDDELKALAEAAADSVDADTYIQGCVLDVYIQARQEKQEEI